MKLVLAALLALAVVGCGHPATILRYGGGANPPNHYTSIGVVSTAPLHTPIVNITRASGTTIFELDSRGNAGINPGAFDLVLQNNGNGLVALKRLGGKPASFLLCWSLQKPACQRVRL